MISNVGTVQKVRVGLIGDVHQTIEHLEYAMDALAAQGVTTFIQVGDYKLYTTAADRLAVEDRLSGLERRHGHRDGALRLLFICGNREDYRFLDPGSRGLVQISRRVTYVPRGLTLDIGGVRYGFCGGADSPTYADDEFGVNRWLDERISTTHLRRALGMSRVDVLITHESTPSGFAAMKQAGALRYSQKEFGHEDRDAVAEIVKATSPRWHVHGHYHHYLRYHAGSTAAGTDTQTLGLGARGGYGCAAVLGVDGPVYVAEAMPGVPAAVENMTGPLIRGSETATDLESVAV